MNKIAFVDAAKSFSIVACITAFVCALIYDIKFKIYILTIFDVVTLTFAVVRLIDLILKWANLCHCLNVKIFWIELSKYPTMIYNITDYFFSSLGGLLLCCTSTALGTAIYSCNSSPVLLIVASVFGFIGGIAFVITGVVIPILIAKPETISSKILRTIPRLGSMSRNLPISININTNNPEAK